MTRFAFRPADRLPEGADFVSAVRRSPAAETDHLRVHARANGLARSRLGISVGRRFGGAVARNRLKRLVRERFRLTPEVRSAGLDIVVVAKGAGVLERPEEITRALLAAARRAGPGRDRA